jgi:hypothetical protein
MYVLITFILENGYGSKTASEGTLREAFAKFYNLDFFPTFNGHSSKDERIVDIGHGPHGTQFYKDVYYQRIRLSAETFLIGANQRGIDRSMNVHAFIVGLGLGVWCLSSTKTTIQVCKIICHTTVWETF